ncbi:hypothetical protein GALMADRAFT_231594 [Galerina marginata CBS 339.88]|uniref:Uncharacterized protein n=1 Tax=Galerina marginata (strain CBS 339.88) TaxID=685588 RepID=A0A067SAU0_GALM3|nr:hypothetical protein GALMADRAFT_231594 [Galerina marginata CBS 339.88]
MLATSIRLFPTSISKKWESQTLDLLLQPSDGQPTPNEMAKALLEFHLDHPENLDDSWDYPTITTSSSVDYWVTRPSPKDRTKLRKKEIASSLEIISNLVKEVEDLKEQINAMKDAMKARSKTIGAKLEELREATEALRQDALQSIAIRAEQTKAALPSHDDILHLETLNRALQALDDIIKNANRMSNLGITMH